MHEQQILHIELGVFGEENDLENRIPPADALYQRRSRRDQKLSQRRASCECTGSLTENSVKRFLNGAKSAQIHWHLLEDKAIGGPMLERLARRDTVELRVETNNVCLMTCFEKTRGTGRR